MSIILAGQLSITLLFNDETHQLMILLGEAHETPICEEENEMQVMTTAAFFADLFKLYPDAFFDIFIETAPTFLYPASPASESKQWNSLIEFTKTFASCIADPKTYLKGTTHRLAMAIDPGKKFREKRHEEKCPYQNVRFHWINVRPFWILVTLLTKWINLRYEAKSEEEKAKKLLIYKDIIDIFDFLEKPKAWEEMFEPIQAVLNKQYLKAPPEIAWKLWSIYENERKRFLQLLSKWPEEEIRECRQEFEQLKKAYENGTLKYLSRGEVPVCRISLDLYFGKLTSWLQDFYAVSRAMKVYDIKQGSKHPSRVTNGVFVVGEYHVVPMENLFKKLGFKRVEKYESPDRFMCIKVLKDFLSKYIVHGVKIEPKRRVVIESVEEEGLTPLYPKTTRTSS